MEYSSMLRRGALLLGFALSLGGCTAVSLIETENEWRSAYRGMVESDAMMAKNDLLIGGDDSLEVSSAYQGKLKDLATRAKTAGDKIVAEDPATAVGFFRVAALAAWKSGTDDIGQIDNAKESGNAACKSLKEKKPPRDCALFDYVRWFAAADGQSLYQIQLRTRYPDPNRLPTSVNEDIEKRVGVGRDIVVELFKLRNATKLDNSVPKTFLDTFVDKNIERVHCNIVKLAGFLGQGDFTYTTPQSIKDIEKQMADLLPDSFECKKKRWRNT